ncbi:AsmA-like C-terminal region-containing protein [Hymenobacter latericus]|uniref:AsmA-like C-terminal region-containing protein n=1 Tax=Hymenobacter sp. YIM 151858-1 TaxID=2987688 RepID=UPI0022270876|nr:AsmA-like C-terminal region-containing protein [Hymenobacter sp. YIM 151858-1]UYZ58474.1 AsmA-like C-terminal region-containing protein [Hymenobacter sp. YIM 151858-1]
MRALKWFGYGLLSVLLLALGLAAALWLGEDRIINLFVTAANRHLRTPVQVQKLELSWREDFPRVSILLTNVRVGGSLPLDTVALARVRRLHCSFDAWDVLGGRYRIRTLTVEQGAVQVRLNQHGQPNYLVLRPDTAANGDEPLRFDFERVRVRNVAVSYADSSLRQRYTLHAHDLTAALRIAGDTVQVQATGPLRVEGLRVGPDTYFRQRELTVNTALAVNRATRQVRIQPSEVQVGPAVYTVAGTVGWRGPTQLALQLGGKNTDVQSLLALLPPRFSKPLAVYRSEGAVYFGGTVKGELSAKHYPRVDVRFGCRDASFVHPQTKQRIEHVFLTGAFRNGPQALARTAVLELSNIRGRLGGKPFSGSLSYRNFHDPYVRLNLRAELEVADALRFYPVAALHQASGQLRLEAQLAGNLRTFRQNPARAAGEASGELQLRNVSLRLRKLNLGLTQLNGSFLLRRNDVAVSNFTGRAGSSDFRLNGLFRNALGWLLLPRQPLRVEADVAARLLNLDELLQAGSSGPANGPAPRAATAANGYALQLPPNIDLDLNATVQQLRFRSFRARALSGAVRMHEQVLTSPGIALSAAAGRLQLRGTLDARQPGLLKVSTVASCQQVRLDSLFYAFEDFGQHFITSRHLRGQLSGTAEADMYFGPQLQPLTNKLEAEVRATVRHGELNNFGPAQQLSMLASREQLRRLRFDELTNTIYIQSRTVYVPDMEIRSNVRRASVIRVTGTHTFDQQMDYHLTIPLLPGLRRPVLAGADGSLAKGPDLLLRVWGNEDKFRVAYDRERAVARRREAGSPAPGGPAQAPAGNGGGATPAAAAPAVRSRPPTPAPPHQKKPASPQPGEYFEF